MSFRNTKTPNRTEGRHKWQLPTRIGRRGATEFYMTPELEELFRANFPKHSNRRIMQWFGIGFATLQRFKRRMGLEKDMAKIRREQASDTKRICEANGYYDSIRGKRPSEATIEGARRVWANGNHPFQILKEKNPARYKRMLVKMGEARKELFRRERMRERLGLTRETRFRRNRLGLCKNYSTSERNRRRSAFKSGYILGDVVTERYIIYWDDETERRPVFEKNCEAAGFKVLELKKEKKRWSQRAM